MKSPAVHLYGLFVDRVCVYVGQTIDTKTRFRAHRNPTRGIARHLTADLTMQVFRQSSAVNAGRLEAQIIAAYRRRGQAKLNRNRGGGCGPTDCQTTPIWCVTLKESYVSLAQAGRALNVDPNTIARALKINNGRLLSPRWSRGRVTVKRLS